MFNFKPTRLNTVKPMICEFDMQLVMASHETRLKNFP